jgi:hypothetical protein
LASSAHLDNPIMLGCACPHTGVACVVDNTRATSSVAEVVLAHRSQVTRVRIPPFFWLKTPGASDGACGTFPAAGAWLADYALGLARRAAF